MNLNLCAVLRCIQTPFIHEPLPICRQHAVMLSQNITDRLYSNAIGTSTASDLDIDKAAVAPDNVWGQPSHPSVVYFMTNGDRVKIGVSTNITARVGALSLRRSNAALLLNGDSRLENALHAHFDSDRVGKTEWFLLSVRIKDYIARRKEADAALRQPQLPDDPGAPPSEAPAKPATAQQRLLDALHSFADPAGLETIYVTRETLSRVSGVTGSTFDNTLSAMTRKELIHRGADCGRERGTYALGRLPD
ncbi:GIY-YIG nuclease family protein (plasmid) [Streptomyces sp. NBC_01723]|uniref:GIY-YIG nuclease family protein n=1 Tax=Streptomyces sp. NBC_01723 TaxID=2975921 RepID=UPI002E36F3C2|nr:GIY-YIG nuclease family protein [Streptomyces sp. NBC_01723]